MSKYIMHFIICINLLSLGLSANDEIAAAKIEIEAAKNEIKAAKVLWASKGKNEAALEKLLLVAKTSKDKNIISEAYRMSARVALRVRKNNEALHFAKQIPLEKLSKTTQMSVLCSTRSYQEIVDNFKAEDIDSWPEAIMGDGFRWTIKGDAFRWRGTAYYNLKRGKKAEVDLIKAVDNLALDRSGIGYAQKGRTMILLGKTYSELLNDNQKAIQIYRKVFKVILYDHNVQCLALRNISEIFLKLNQPEKAIKEFDSLDYSKLSGSYYYKIIFLRAKGKALVAVGRHDEAIEIYRKALALNGIGNGNSKFCRDQIASLMKMDKSKILIASDGTTNYQIIIPDKSKHPVVDKLIMETAELVKKAFAANNFKITIAYENEKNSEKPGIYLGNTKLARDNNIDVSKFEGWSYIQKVVGKNLIIAGNDIPGASKIMSGSRELKAPQYKGVQVGTTKGVADFLRKYVQTRFLYPKGDTGIEFINTPAISVPANLNKVVKPNLKMFFGKDFGQWGTTSLTKNLYMIANNYFPRIKYAGIGHSYPNAIPVEKYSKSHPEYFALIGKQRVKKGHYCISNQDVQELMYQYMVDDINNGNDIVSLGQQDGFMACQCKACHDLYGTGNDWDEKLWIFHRKLAERLLKEHPGKKVVVASYGNTWTPPKTFKEFPENVIILLCKAAPYLMEQWKNYKVPGGFYGYLYYWGYYNDLGFTPQQSPLGLANIAKRIKPFGFKGFYADGFGFDFGLGGPAYYVFGNMLSNPDNIEPKIFLEEYYEAAFGEVSGPMRKFFNTLYQTLDFYKSMENPHTEARSYTDIYGRKKHFVLRDPLRLMAILYSPDILKEMETQLSRAEKQAEKVKVKSRLKLVRYEFDYLSHTVKVAHLYEAFKIVSTPEVRGALLDQIDKRNEFLDTIFKNKHYQPAKIIPDWPEFQLFCGHSRGLLKINGRPNKSKSVLEWDTTKHRNMVLSDSKKIFIKKIDKELTIDSKQWNNFIDNNVNIGIFNTPESDIITTVKIVYNNENLYLRYTCSLSDKKNDYQKIIKMSDGDTMECVDLALDPFRKGEKYYRFIAGPKDNSRYEGAFGLITDNLHPLYGKEDESWEGDWKRQFIFKNNKQLIIMLTIPFKSLGVDTPVKGAIWGGNFGRTHAATKGEKRFIWNGNSETKGISTIDDFGELIFGLDCDDENLSLENRAKKGRIAYSEKTYFIPKQWENLPGLINNPFKSWIFREDPANVGIKEKWFAPSINTSRWKEVEVPAFWAETKVGDYTGYGWYRTEFKAPKSMTGKHVRFLFGGVDEEAWVYFNGKLVKAHSKESEGLGIDQLWDAPFEVEVKPEAIKVNQVNYLSVRVNNAVMAGGIWRPVLVQVVD